MHNIKAHNINKILDLIDEVQPKVDKHKHSKQNKFKNKKHKDKKQRREKIRQKRGS